MKDLDDLAVDAARTAFDALIEAGKAELNEREDDPRYWQHVHAYKAEHLPRIRWLARLIHRNRARHYAALADAAGKSC